MKRLIKSLLSLVIVVALGSLILFLLRGAHRLKPADYPDGSLVIGNIAELDAVQVSGNKKYKDYIYDRNKQRRIKRYRKD